MSGLVVFAADVGSVERGNFARQGVRDRCGQGCQPRRGDAQRAIEAFITALPEPESSVEPRGAELVSLIGAALVRAGWTTRLAALGEPCLVVRA